jgi:hypothetical protein
MLCALATPLAAAMKWLSSAACTQGWGFRDSGFEGLGFRV